MANNPSTESSSSGLHESTPPSEIQLHIRGVPFSLDKELVASKSSKLAMLFNKKLHEDISYHLRDIPANPETFELVARFCHGFELNISVVNVVPLACLAHYLGMTESHCQNNLLNKTFAFFEQRVLPRWNNTVKALLTVEYVLQHATRLGLVDACFESIIAMAKAKPSLLGEQIDNRTFEDDDSENNDENGCDYKPNARRKLFVLDSPSENLTSLSLRLYEPLIYAMIRRGVPSEYIAASLSQYFTKWVIPNAEKEDVPILKRNSRREMIEAIERLLPTESGLVPCTILFQMLYSAIFLEAKHDCRNGFEIRIGKQLDEATCKDLLIPSQGYAKEVKYDIECVKRILKNFYANYSRVDLFGLVRVAELLEEFLAEIATDIDLKTNTFVSLAEMSIAASEGTQRNSDGIYRAIDVYLDTHKYLTESEKEGICQVLDYHKLSFEACSHAMQNERLPLRTVVQVLFASQLHLKETVIREVNGSTLSLGNKEEDEEEEEEAGEEGRVSGGGAGEEVRMEMEKMGNKVMELERECSLMRREIEVKKEKGSNMWRELKRKLGCGSSTHERNSQVMKKKKVHPRHGV